MFSKQCLAHLLCRGNTVCQTCQFFVVQRWSRLRYIYDESQRSQRFTDISTGASLNDNPKSRSYLLLPH